ncbi:hypothetical protein L6452_27998 [Arctium lappa]|uniref:Uncharacterized protein n=1 Tax=Arctium lappa TaxID=4217 RepID=A0ACB9A1K2_ARCLA|nr:hypothetical protein L6452_27998 [Arctium lappa]
MMKSLTQGPMEIPRKVIPATATTPATTIEKALREYEAEEVLKYQADSQALSNLILALPNSIYNRIDCFKHNPMLMWTQLEKIMLGTAMSTQLRQTRYMNNFEKFKAKYGAVIKDGDVIRLCLVLQLAEQALTESAYDGSTDDNGEAFEKAIIFLTQHYQKRFKHKSGSNNLRFTSGSKKIELGAPSNTYTPKYEPAKVVEQKKDDKKVMNCFNCGKTGHMVKDCRVKVVKDAAFYRKKLALAEKKESGTILMAEEEYWLDHSDNEAENEETAAMCFIGDDNSDDEEEDTSSDGSEFKFFWTTEKQILEEENVKMMKNKRMEMPFV